MNHGEDVTTDRSAQPLLRRLIGTATVACVGVGGAIGSGVFRTPGDIASMIRSPWLILLLWLIAGIITLLQSLVTAELATRIPHAGGEYQFLKEAYGNFAAFFFGWSFSFFIVGAGAGTIAASIGDFSAELLRTSAPWVQPVCGCAAIVLVVAINAAGLYAGAMTQNILTILKIAALAAIAIGAMMIGKRVTPAPIPAATPMPMPSLSILLMAMLSAYWPYTGATDSAKLAEEVRDVHRALPRALITAVVILTAVYLMYNYALLCALSPVEMAGESSVHAVIFDRLSLTGVRELILLASILVCLGSLAAVFLANVRVIYAMARDGLAFRVLAKMSKRQSPVVSLLACGVIACVFVMNRSFEQIMRIYFMGSAFLFGLTYLSLIIFRLRDKRAGRPFPITAYRVPGGMVVAAILILIELCIGISLVWEDVKTWNDGNPNNNLYDSIYSMGMLASMALLYVVWQRFTNLPKQERAT